MYCTHCGTKMYDQDAYCSNCGERAIMINAVHSRGAVTSARQAVVEDYAYTPTINARLEMTESTLIRKISNRVKVNGIIWLAIGIIQIGLGIEFEWVWTFVVGILNMISSIKEIRFSNRIKKAPVGIVEGYKPLVGPIITMLYNLFVGGVIGAIGSIYYFAGIRSLVMNNQSLLIKMEKDYKNKYLS